MDPGESATQAKNHNETVLPTIGIGMSGALGGAASGSEGAMGGAESTVAAGGAPRLLSQFTKSTVDDVAASAGRLSPGGQITQGARAIAKKLGHAQSGGYTSAFAGVEPTQANAAAIIRITLQSPAGPLCQRS